jgi:hypothetical protein
MEGFTMKRILCLLLAAAIMMTGGCNNDSSRSNVSETSEVSETSGISTTSPTVSESSDITGDERPVVFEWMDEAFQNIYLFGHRISLPSAISEWGEDFSLFEGMATQTGNTNHFVGILLYKGDKIGLVTLLDCAVENNENRQVVNIILGDGFQHPIDSSGGDWYEGIIQVDFLGVSFVSTKEEVMEKLGTPAEWERNSYRCELVYMKTENERIVIWFRDEKVVRIVFNNET